MRRRRHHPLQRLRTCAVTGCGELIAYISAARLYHAGDPDTRNPLIGDLPISGPNSDAPAVAPAGVSMTARSDLCAPGANQPGTGA